MREVEGLSARYTAKAGLKFSVGRTAKAMTKGNYGRFTELTAVYLSAVLEYLSTEVLEVAGNAAKDHKRTRIMTNHIQLALKNDSELSRVFGSDTKQDKDTAKPLSSGNSTAKPKVKAKAKGKGKAKTRPASYKSLAIQLNNMTL